MTALLLAFAIDCYTTRQIGQWLVGQAPIAYTRTAAGCRIAWDDDQPVLRAWCASLGQPRCRVEAP